jgi:uncharacterized protein (TIGR00255 family)
MIQSMTGYGKAEVILDEKKCTIEIRSLNGKNCDISLKTQFIPRDKELEIRQLIAQKLVRGNIDLYINVEYSEGTINKEINKDVLLGYYHQLLSIKKESDISQCNDSDLLSSLLRLPDVIDTKKDEVTDEKWNLIYKGISKAIDHLIEFREREGATLDKDISSHVENILSSIPEVEQFENERITSIKERLKSKIAELSEVSTDNRLEQEIIFYIEKLDINEEKVRLRNHCHYFNETKELEEYPGKKLGFIAQEMGREINTLGSKANHSEIQKIVVKMKDELEKIKEQSLNIL